MWEKKKCRKEGETHFRNITLLMNDLLSCSNRWVRISHLNLRLFSQCIRDFYIWWLLQSFFFNDKGKCPPFNWLEMKTPLCLDKSTILMIEQFIYLKSPKLYYQTLKYCTMYSMNRSFYTTDYITSRYKCEFIALSRHYKAKKKVDGKFFVLKCRYRMMNKNLNLVVR